MKTAEMKEGVPLPCRISMNSDRSYDLVIHNPPATFFLKQAAGIQRGTMTPGREVAGMITLKHLYEIAAIKIQDPPNAMLTMKVCRGRTSLYSLLIIFFSFHSKCVKCSLELQEPAVLKLYETWTQPNMRNSWKSAKLLSRSSDANYKRSARPKCCELANYSFSRVF